MTDGFVEERGVGGALDEDKDRPFSVLMVCTGNICRSPLAEQLLIAALEPAGIPLRVTSAGTRALVGQPMTPEAAQLSRVHGGDPDRHVARQLTRELVEGADLILTATRDHRGEVVSLSPVASRLTFTLRQFARITAAGVAEVEPPEAGVTEPGVRPALQAYVAAVAASRGFAPPPERATDDDVEDPYRQSKQVYRRAARAIDEAVRTIGAGLARAAADR